MKKWTLGGALAVVLALAGTNANALMIAPTNLVDLVRDADVIVVGTVTTVTDGLDDTNGLPYSEVTLSLRETIRGLPSDNYTFRQFGLTNPRPTADGTMMIPAAPDGMPRYAVGDYVLLFMGAPASMTGLQSPIGLGYGKFTLGAGTAENDYRNAGVFQNVSLGAGLATDNDARILTTTNGPVNPDDLLSLVRRAVQNNWVQNCKMWITDQDTPRCVGQIARPQPGPVTPPLNPNPNPSQTPTTHQRLVIK